MRNATILVIRLKGTATETIKNIVLAGIGKLVIVDWEEVSAVDLGAGFFFRDEDIGKKVCCYSFSLHGAPPGIQWYYFGRFAVSQALNSSRLRGFSRESMLRKHECSL